MNWIAKRAGGMVVRLVVGSTVAVALSIVSTASSWAQTYSEQTIYPFVGGTNGSSPKSALVVDTEGNLYGTATQGGASGYGTVFEIPASGGYLVLHSFTGGAADGAGPFGALVEDGAGNLYGTTSGGGPKGYGTIFEVFAGGGETILHSFNGGTTDGVSSYAGLLLSNGTLYGTTARGGLSNQGTVFAEPVGGGNDIILYNFAGGTADGSAPFAGVELDASGDLWGTTSGGGAYGHGTVFEVPAGGGPELFHYSFGTNGSTDGAAPYAGVIFDPEGNLYGTTAQGGASGLGTVFEISAADQYSVLYNFAGGTADGASPYAGLTLNALASTLYGTTSLLGTTSSGGAYSYGTVFEVFPDNVTAPLETVHYSFTGYADGGNPYGGLTFGTGKCGAFCSTLYGATFSGFSGLGTVISLSALGNGVDISSSSGDVKSQVWKNMSMAGIQYAVVQAWGGCSTNTYAPAQLKGAQSNLTATAGFALLTFFPASAQKPCGGKGLTGAQQVDMAMTAMGPAFAKVKFVMIDIEKCCGEIFSGVGTNVVDEAERIDLISSAVGEIGVEGKYPVIYTTSNFWKEITGNCTKGTNSTCTAFYGLPLWDNDNPTTSFVNSDGQSHCSNGIIGLQPFTDYLYGGWTKRSANQYDLGIPPNCPGNALFGIKALDVDLDYFDPTLFQ